MTTARFRIGRDGYRLTGREIIRHGVRACE